MSEKHLATMKNWDFCKPHLPDLWEAAKAAKINAYAPYSNFFVGSAVLLTDGKICKGCNIENASYGLTICAERVAISQVISEGRFDIVAIAIVSSALRPTPPCGACRQVIAEFSQIENPIIVITYTEKGEPILEIIDDLLPKSFTLL